MTESTDNVLDRARGWVRLQHDVSPSPSVLAAAEGARIMRDGGRKIYVHQHITVWTDGSPGEFESLIEHIEAEGWRLDHLGQSSTTSIADRTIYTLVFRSTE
ncbi:MAG TPA: hypothetical protein VGB64_11915 [Actinomycetota bacterium]